MSGKPKIEIQDKRVNVAVSRGTAPAVVVTSSTLSAKISVSSVGVGGITSLAGLSDTTIVLPADGELLVYDLASGKWINIANPFTTLEALTDTTISIPLDGQPLIYDTVNGWINEPSYIFGSLGMYTTDGKSLGTSVFPWNTVFANFIQSGIGTKLNLTSGISDGVGAEAFKFNTQNSLTDSPDRALFALLNNNSYALSIGTKGEHIWWDSTQGSYFNTWTNDGITAIAHTFNTENNFATIGAKLFSLQNNSVEKLSVDKDGNIETLGGIETFGKLKTVVSLVNDFAHWIENTNTGRAFGMVCRVDSDLGYAAQFQNLVGLDDDLQIFIGKSDRMIQCVLGVNDVFAISKDGIVTSVGNHISSVADGATSIAHTLDTANFFNNSDSKILSLKNGGSEIFSVKNLGNIDLTSSCIFTKPSAFDNFDFYALDANNRFTVTPAVGAFSTDNGFGLMTFANIGGGETMSVDNGACYSSGGTQMDLGTSLNHWKDLFIDGTFDHRATTGAIFSSSVADGVGADAFVFDTTNDIALGETFTLRNSGVDFLNIKAGTLGSGNLIFKAPGTTTFGNGIIYKLSNSIGFFRIEDTVDSITLTPGGLIGSATITATSDKLDFFVGGFTAFGAVPGAMIPPISEGSTLGSFTLPWGEVINSGLFYSNRAIGSATDIIFEYRLNLGGVPTVGVKLFSWNDDALGLSEALSYEYTATDEWTLNMKSGNFNSEVVDSATAIAFEFDTTNLIAGAPTTAKNAKLLSIKTAGAEKIYCTLNSLVQEYANIHFVDSEATTNNFYFGYSEFDTQYAGMFNDFGDFWLGVSSDPTTYINFYAGTKTQIGTAINTQEVIFYTGTNGFKINYSGATGNAFEIKEGAIDYFTIDNAGVALFGKLIKTKVGTFESQVLNSASAIAFDLNTTASYTTTGAKLLSLKNNTVEKLSVDKDGNIFLTEAALLGTLVNGAIEYNNGHLYFTHGNRVALVGANGVKKLTTTVVNTVVETVIYSHTFAANSLHTDERIIAALTGAITTASGAEAITIKFKLGGVVVHTINATPGNGTDIAWKAIHEGTIRTDGATGTYIDFSEFSESGVPSLFVAETTTHSINTTISNLYEITVTWGAAKAGNSFSCTQGDLTFKH